MDAAREGELTGLPEGERELREELQKAKDNHNIATGAIASLHRQLEIQESQLRAMKSEKETLQKRLRERENQLQAMSTKFFSLKRERQHEEIMVAIEKENFNLRQVAMEQSNNLAEQSKLIDELQRTVSELQAEVLSGRCHIHKLQQAQAATQSQVEMLQHRELKTRVALESVISRFERYRRKVIQATFSTAGSKPPQVEVTDEELLEAMQKIINERTEFHQMLKQKGIKVPPLHSMNPPPSSPTSTKGRRKSPSSRKSNQSSSATTQP